MLLSATIVFFPLVSIGGIEISIKSAIQSVYSGYGSSGAATGLISALGSYAKPYMVMALGWFLFTVLSAVSVLMAKKKTAYLSAIIEQVIQIFIAVSLYMKVKRKLSLVYSAISFVGLGNGVKVHILPILFWVVLQIICFIINIMEITTKEETMMEVLPPVLPVWNKDKIEQIIEKIKGQMELRKRIFAENECNTYASYLEVTGRKLPMILLLIDNYSVFRERMYKLVTMGRNEDDNLSKM